jgi:hypothetical protein
MPLDPHIDFTEEFRFLGEYTLPFQQYGGSFAVDVPFRSDACLIQVRMTLGGDHWRKAGYVRQLWNSGLSEYPVTLTAKRAWLKQINLLRLEPTEQCQVSFTAVQWLHNWEVKIWARQIINTNVAIEDILLTIVDKEDEILDRLEEIERLVENGATTGGGGGGGGGNQNDTGTDIAAAHFTGLI